MGSFLDNLVFISSCVYLLIILCLSHLFTAGASQPGGKDVADNECVITSSPEEQWVEDGLKQVSRLLIVKHYPSVA